MKSERLEFKTFNDQQLQAKSACRLRKANGKTEDHKMSLRYGLSSVTPEGTVSKRGTVSGGFQGQGSSSESPTVTLLKQKVEIAEAEALGYTQASKLEEIRDEAGSLEAEIAAALCSIEQAQGQQQAVADTKKVIILGYTPPPASPVFELVLDQQLAPSWQVAALGKSKMTP
eukprot:1141598-Pelagomonas_calceolata.AAC.6